MEREEREGKGKKNVWCKAPCRIDGAFFLVGRFVRSFSG